MKEQPLKEHFKYLTGLFEKGILKLGGPFSDGSGGAALIEAKDETDALALIQNDPAVKSGVMTPKITRWELVSWGEVSRQELGKVREHFPLSNGAGFHCCCACENSNARRQARRFSFFGFQKKWPDSPVATL